MAKNPTTVQENVLSSQMSLPWVLSEDPQRRQVIEVLIKGPTPDKFVGVETVALAAAIMVVLQTHLKFERDKDGRVSLKIEKKPTSTTLLKPLVHKLLAFVGSSS